MPEIATLALVDRLTREGLIGLAEAARKLGHAQKKRKPTAKLVRRWCVKGKCGVKLEYLMVGARYKTSWPAVRRFIAATQPADWPAPIPARGRGRDARYKRRNRDRLARLGLYEPRPQTRSA